MSEDRGRFDGPMRRQLRAEGIQFWGEDLRGEITYSRDYRAPGVPLGGKRVPAPAAVAVTRRRVVVWMLGGKHVDWPANQMWPVGVGLWLESWDQVVFGYDAAAFHPSRSGRVEVRVWTEWARELIELAAQPVDPVWGELVTDGIAFLERACPATLVRRGSPRAVTVDVAVSRTRFAVWVGAGKFIDLPRIDGRPRGVAVRLVDPDGVELRLRELRVEPGVDPSIALTITTSNAAELAGLLVGT